ncbi:hypothetical protein ACNKHN_22665 [Shigella flexneri]
MEWSSECISPYAEHGKKVNKSKKLVFHSS